MQAEYGGAGWVVGGGHGQWVAEGVCRGWGYGSEYDMSGFSYCDYGGRDDEGGSGGEVEGGDEGVGVGGGGSGEFGGGYGGLNALVVVVFVFSFSFSFIKGRLIA